MLFTSLFQALKTEWMHAYCRLKGLARDIRPWSSSFATEQGIYLFTYLCSAQRALSV